jgi:protocatechuate 3,4-dioxygenase beta subunit
MNTLKILRLVSCYVFLVLCPARQVLFAAASNQFTLSVLNIGTGNEPSESPGNLTSTAVLAPADERGTRLIITGVIYQSDGKTPLAYAVMYAYQTDASGYYSRETGGNRTPRLNARLKTGPDGKYEIRTIMPGHYPGGKVPSHIHASITPAGGKEVNIDEYLFDGDPFLSKEDYSKFAGHGPLSSIVKTVMGSDGVLRGVRDIIVGPK